MAQYPSRLADLVSLLRDLDRSSRIDCLISIADRFQEVPERVAIRPFPAEHKVPACESEAFLWAEPIEGGRLKFHFAVENPQGISAKAMAVILDDGLSGEAPEAVLSVDGELVYEIFGRELSMGKSMGLMGMVSMVQNSARRLLDRKPEAKP